jgi:hypothetical protein
MSVTLICPFCGNPATLHRNPVSECPQCLTAWPAPLRQSAEAALAREKVSRPLLLTIGMYVTTPSAGLFLLVVILALFNAGSYTVDGEPVSGMEFLRSGGLIFGLGAALCLAAAYGIWQERPWSRWVMAVFWVVQLAGTIGVGWADGGLSGAAGGVAALLLPMVLAGWYLFDKENVVEYYRALEKVEAAANARRAAHIGGGAARS